MGRLSEDMRQLDNMVWSMKSQMMLTEQRLMRVIASLSIVEDTNVGCRIDKNFRGKETDMLPMTRAQMLMLRLGFARFRWFRRRVGGRWCYRRCWLNDYPHSSSTVCVHRWERHPEPTMGDDILEVEQYDSAEFPAARIVDRS